MGGKEYALKCTLGLILFAVLLWQLETNYFPSNENSTSMIPVAVWKTKTDDMKEPVKDSSKLKIKTAKITTQHGINVTTEGSETKRWLVVYWSTFFGRRLNLHETFEKGDCPVPCEWTSDQSRAKEADAFLVHARDPRPDPPIKSVPWILQTRENPIYTPVLYDASFMSKFSYLKSYRLDSDFPDPSVLLPGVAPPVPFKNKTGLIMAAFSNCEVVRTEYMRQLMKFVKVDSFGACLRNNNSLVGRYGKNKQGTDFRDAKSMLARQYKFSLVFFNQDCDYFVDAQLHHAMDAGSVPVVMATDKLDEFLPGPYLNRSVIKVRDFKSPQLLAEYLKYLSNNETEYNKYLEWKWKGYGNISGTAIGNYWMPKYPLYCQVCVAVSKGKGHKEGLKPFNCKPRKFENWGITKGA